MDEKLRRSRKQERRGAKDFGGIVNAGSGNGNHKGDVRTSEENIEFKSTVGKSYSLRHRDLEDAYRNALLIGRRALFGIEFSDGRNSDRYIVLAEDDYLDMKHQLEELHANFRIVDATYFDVLPVRLDQETDGPSA